MELLIALLHHTGVRNTKFIANALYGLGLLSDKGKLKGVVELQSIIPLLKKLFSLLDLNTQGVTNSLKGIGLLARAGNLEGVVELQSIIPLLEKLLSLLDLDAQGIGISLYGIGLLAKAGNLKGQSICNLLLFLCFNGYCCYLVYVLRVLKMASMELVC